MLGDVAQALFNGLSWGMATFLVASGLTLAYGILHIMNLAHGGFFMVGAYLAFTLLGRLGPSSGLAGYAAECLAAGVGVAVLGVLADRLVFRRLRDVDDAYILIATYALLLLTQGATKLVWGTDLRAVDPPAALDGALIAGDVVMPVYALAVIGLGCAVFLALWVVVNRTVLGQRIQSVARDPWMSRLLGVDVDAIRTGVIVASFGLAGIAGGVLAANQSLSPDLGGTFLIQALGAVIVGGMGSVSGTFLAAILLGVVDSLGTYLTPAYPGVWFFAALVAILVVRPRGLLAAARTA